MRFGPLTRYLSSAWDMLFPRRCLVCGQTLSGGEEHVCGACLTTLPLTHLDSRSENAVVRLFYDIEGTQRGVAMLVYRHQNATFRLIHAMKYGDRPAVGVFLGEMMAHQFEPEGFFESVDALVPVPLSARKLRDRGFNQSEAIAQGIATVTGLPIRTDLVARTVDNPTQTNLSTQQRRENVAGIFSAADADTLRNVGNGSPLKEKGNRYPHFLLIDDVITTGATLHALAETLRAAAPCRLSYLSAALAGQHLNVFERGAE
ncbi:MAG: ComF family protein [Bacteroidaceae bacterium]|nr:ComF family protein [Bacteroidaceae bacterium]